MWLQGWGPPAGTEARRARCSPPGSGRFRHRGKAAASRELRGKGTPPGPGTLHPAGAPGPPAYLLHLGGDSAQGHGRQTPARRPEQTKALRRENAPPSPPRSRAAGSPDPRRVGRPQLPDAGPGALRTSVCFSRASPAPARIPT